MPKMREVYGFAGILLLGASLSAACGDDDGTPDAVARGGAATGGSASGGDAGMTALGGSPGAAGAGARSAAGDGGESAAGRGAESGGTSGSNAGGGGGATDRVVGNPERDIELTELEIDLANQTAVAKITLAPATISGATFSVLHLDIRSITFEGEPLRYSVNPEDGTEILVEVPASAESGAFFLRAQEQRVGRQAFDEALRAFYLRWAGKAASVQDLMEVVAEVADYDPQQCADAWLVQLAIPALEPCP